MNKQIWINKLFKTIRQTYKWKNTGMSKVNTNEKFKFIQTYQQTIRTEGQSLQVVFFRMHWYLRRDSTSRGIVSPDFLSGGIVHLGCILSGGTVSLFKLSQFGKLCKLILKKVCLQACSPDHIKFKKLVIVFWTS